MTTVEPASTPRLQPPPFAYQAFFSYSHAADGHLAAFLQNAVQGFAKPWYRRRAIRLFRDMTGLSVTPDLWARIRQALGSSEYFVLFASEQSARSHWVELEIDTWLQIASPDRLLIVWTDGTLVWDGVANDFDWTRTTCLHPRLRGVFHAEPLYVDLRWARKAADLSPRRPELLDAAARLSATIRGIPLDDLIGEDARQHRRTRRLAAAAMTALVALLVSTAIAAVLAFQQRNAALNRLVDLTLANGIRLGDEEDVSGAALWFAEALRLDTRGGDHTQLHRIRVGTALTQHPRLLHLWSADSGSSRIRVDFSRTGREIVARELHAESDPPRATSPDAPVLHTVWRVWDLKSGAAMALNVPPGSKVLTVDATDASLRAVVRDEHGATEIVEAQSGATIQLQHSATAASFSADGSLLVTSSDDGAVKIWKSDTGGLVRTFEHDHPVQDAALTRDNQRLVTFTDDGAAHIWPTADTRPHESHIRLQHDDPIDQVDISRDGRFVVTVALRDARLFDVSTPRSPKHVWSWSGVNSAEFSPTGSLLLMADVFGQTRLYDAENTKDVAVVNLGAVVLHAAFTPDGKRFATADTDRITRVWTVGGDPVSPPLHHEDTVSDVAFNREGSQLVTVTADGLVRVWDLAIGPPPMRDPSVDRVVFAPRGTRFLTITRSEARIWNSTAGPPLILSAKSQLYDAAFSPDARRVVTTTEDHRARIWDAASGAELLSLEDDVRVQSASFRPDGAWLATAGANGGTAVVTIWELATGRRLFTLPHTDRRPTHVEFSRDGSRLLTLGSNDLTVWDVGTKREIPGLRFDDVTAASFSSDSRFLLVRRSGSVRVYDVARGEAGAELRHENYLLDDALFGSDGKSLVIAGGGYARVWDARSGAAVTRLLDHGSRANVRHAVMSGDGRFVVTAADDGSARLWDARTGQPLSPRLTHGNDTPAIAIAPDATRMATAGNNVVRLWQLSPEGSLPDAEQATVARVLAAREIDATGAIAPLDRNAMLQVWSSLTQIGNTHR